MSKKSKKEHRKKVAARNQRNANKKVDANKILNSGMATPDEARHIGKMIASKGHNPIKVFNRKTT